MSGRTDAEQAWLEAVGLRLRLGRVKRRLSQRRAAKLAGLSSVTLGSMERAEHVAGLQSYVQAARAVDLPLAELLDGAP